MSYQVLAAGQWAAREFGTSELGDVRLTRRAVRVAEAMAANPSGSIPGQSKNWGATKGAYRLFDHERVTFDSISQAHWNQTRASAGQCEVTLMIQDTTWLNYATHPSTAGLGRHGRRNQGRGLLEHSVLAVEPQANGSGRVLGLAWGQLWARREESIGVKGKRRNAVRGGPDLESRRWAQAVQEVGAPPSGARWIHVGDRESDLFELFEQTRRMPGLGFVVRLCKERNAEAGHSPSALAGTVLQSRRRPRASLKQICRSMPQLGQTQLWVAPQASSTGSPRANRPGRWAKLAVSGGAMTIYSPWYGSGYSRRARPLCCWAVRVWEIDPPKGIKEPIEWLLLSSEPVTNLEDALRVAAWYSLRWLIEQYHQCLKSGCKVEERQLESGERLAPLIAMLSVTATRLLQLKNDARLTPDRPARQCVPEESLETMAKLLKINPAKLTVRRFTHEVAKLGGFLARKSDGEPGWLTLWRGWHELDLITRGYHLAIGKKRCG